jgi:hypothetical protein
MSDILHTFKKITNLKDGYKYQYDNNIIIGESLRFTFYKDGDSKVEYLGSHVTKINYISCENSPQ